MLKTTSDGPVLLANLPSGSYTANSPNNGYTAYQMIELTRGQLHTFYLRFPDE